MASEGSEEAEFAPVLPGDVLRRIFSILRQNSIVWLCAPACVCRAWRDAAMDPTFWRELVDFTYTTPPKPGTRFVTRHHLLVTDALLAMLVKRASGHDGVREHHLKALDVRGWACSDVTARGVVAALRGAGLKGKLRSLKVADILCDEDDEDIVPLLRSFLRRSRRYSGLDVSEFRPCTERNFDDDGTEREVCSRLCVDFSEVDRCTYCYYRE
jgi:hypothetical protein